MSLLRRSRDERKVGDVGSRMFFSPHEQVFSEKDMSTAAIAARAAVKHQLESRVLTLTQPDWNASTLPQRTQHEDNEHFDNKFFASVQTEYLVKKARARVDAIRKGEDPDFDHKSIQPRWNVSSKLEDDEGHLHLPDALANLVHRNPPLPDYRDPVESEREFEHAQRQRKAAQQAYEAEKRAKQQQAAEWEAKESWNGPLEPIKITQPVDTSDLRCPIDLPMTLNEYTDTIEDPSEEFDFTVKKPTLSMSTKSFEKFSHFGHFDWVELDNGELIKRWSCCFSKVETHPGCKKLGTVADKARLVPKSAQHDYERSKAKVVRYIHTGVYQPLAVGGMSVWSCCSAESSDALGCVRKTVANEQRWNIESVP